MPLTRNDTVFAYFSTSFFQQLVSPHYQIELARRLRASTDMELLWMARLAAEGRGISAESTHDLIHAGLLPVSFAVRPEGGEVQIEDNQFIDTLRGARGSFLPIPDVEIAGTTQSEAVTCARRNEYYASHWKQFDPLMVGVHFVSADYFRTLHIPLRSGRTLTADDRAGLPRVALINDAAARRYWPGESPLGRRFRLGIGWEKDEYAEIVGVVGDVQYRKIDEVVQPEVYLSHLQPTD